MALEGDLQNIGLPRVLHAIAVMGQNGILTVQRAEDIVAVSILAGAIVAADSLNQTTEEALGDALIGRDLVTREDFDAVAKEYDEAPAGSLGDLLVSRGLIEREALLDVLRQQTHQLMLQLLTWQQGDFKFYGGDEVSYEEGFRPLAVEELLVRSIEELGGRGRLKGPVPDLEAAYRRVPPRSPVRVIGRDGDGLGPGAWISPRQGRLMQRLDGKQGAAAVVRELGYGQYQALFDLYHLLQHDLVEHLGAVASAPGAPGVRAGSPHPGAPRPGAPQPGTPRPGTPQLGGRTPTEGVRVGSASAVTATVTATATSAVTAPEETAGVFVPPDPGSYEADIGPRADGFPLGAFVQRRIGLFLAVVLMLTIVLSLFERPGAVLLPFPWQENQRETIERQLRYSLFLKIDRAARAYFLVQAHYPDSLQELVDLGLLSSSDLRDPAGYELSYSSAALRYRIDLLDDGQIVEGLGTSESATGDFLLDPQILRTGGAQEVPLVLLE